MPDNRRVILHVGAGKCGSSSLQRSLSLKPVLPHASGQTFEYVVIQEGGILQRGAALTHHANTSVYGYASSFAPSSGTALKSIETGLANVADLPAEITPILSCEGWINRPEAFHDSRMLDHLGLTAEVVIYVRPQLDWLNSGWWQWGAWSEHPRSYWMERSLGRVKWDLAVQAWRRVPGVSKVHVRLVTSDITVDFGSIFGITLAPVGRVNSSSDGMLLRMLQRIRSLRRHEHDSMFEFAFAKWAPGPREKPAWVIPPEDCVRYLEAVKHSNLTLLDHLDPASAQAMKDDPRWWDAAHYATHKVEPAELDHLPLKTYEQILERAFKALINHIKNKPPE
ncbi:hypothetical protein, partial [Parasulfitobacter algicola]